MEEKKIMWVVLSISLFVLVVFGSALFLYSPSKFQSPNATGDFAYIKDISDSPASLEKIDPDMWARQGERVPGFKASEEDDVKKNITVIDGSEVEGKDAYIDVSPSNDEYGSRGNKGKKLPDEVAIQLGSTDDRKGERRREEGMERRDDISISSNGKSSDFSKNGSDSSSNTMKENVLPVSEAGRIKKVKTSKDSESQEKAQRTYEKKTTAKTYREKTSTAKVAIETVYWVQTASLSSRLNAEKARDKLAERHMKVQIFTRDRSSGLTHRVRVGPFSNKTEAEYWLKNIKDIQGFEQSYISEERVRV